MTTLSPNSFPLDGNRGLTLKERLLRQAAMACPASSDGLPSCNSQVFVGLFFDGTGNNLHNDYEVPPPEQRRHSNIVRLFHTFRNEPDREYLRYYIPGVGTPFPEIGDDDGKFWSLPLGSAGAFKGEARIIWAFMCLLNAPYRHVWNSLLIPNDQARIIVDNVGGVGSSAAQRHLVLNTWQDRLRKALRSGKPRVTQITLSVFGFSRGAAEARTFVNWLFEVCTSEQGNWTFAGVPLRVQFLGLFDTVASVGLANLYDNGWLAGHQSWADNSQEIHPAVERCVHFVAGHEVRACFPLDSVRVKARYPANAREVMYPGAHSDVGGGYAPGDLGVGPSAKDMLSMIPARDMYEEARRAGVPLLPIGRLDERFVKDLTPSTETTREFNAYLRDAAVGSGPVEEMGRRHMAYFFSYRFKYRGLFRNRPPHTRATAGDQDYLSRTQDALITRLSRLAAEGVGPDGQEPRPKPYHAAYQGLTAHENEIKTRALRPNFNPGEMAERFEKRNPLYRPSVADRQLLAIARAIDEKSLTPDIERLFEKHVHDSMAGFIALNMDEYRRNGMGLAKFRTVFKGDD